ncbi:hypothetical protein [Pantoea septica]|nr:hypothetical protein [Pantoea septica]
MNLHLDCDTLAESALSGIKIADVQPAWQRVDMPELLINALLPLWRRR